MSQEYEAQILDINKKDFRKSLKKLGGKRVHKKFKMMRSVYELCTETTKGFVRVRKEYSGTTMTVKVYKNKDFPEEYEVSIKEDFEKGKSFLDALNLKMKAYQETYREKWSLPIKGVHEITIDIWPGLPPYAEIDCTSESVLRKVIKLLNISEDQLAYGPSATKYQYYYDISEDDINKNTPIMTFKDIKDQIFPKKNKSLFDKISHKFRKL